MKNVLAALLLLLCAGCASVPPATAPAESALFRDARFAAPGERIDAADVFAITPEMRRYLRREIGRQLEDKGWHRGLVDALYRDGQ